MIGWNFPLSEGGPIQGISDPGIETFKGDPLNSLAREVCQNSLDAKDDKVGDPVVVEFALERLPSNQFPGLEDLKQANQACLEYWRQDNKVREFFGLAINVLQSEEISFLRISDFNTTGLLGANSDGRSDWHNLVKSVGVSEKSAMQAGSFGIGKFAPFACTALRTVFYATLDRKNVVAFQGGARLVTHVSTANGGRQALNIGFYGIKDGNTPILDTASIPERFSRRKVGTDIWIPGFTYEESWKDAVIKSILKDFFVAVHRQLLVVKVDDITIDHVTLPDLLREHIADDRDCHADLYYDTLVSEDASEFRQENFENMGEVILRIKLHKDGPKRVAMFRGTGMLIFEKMHFRTPSRFAGVFEARGELLNEFLRLLEPPKHNAWKEEEYSEDPEEVKEASSLLRKLNKWIHQCVKETSPVPDTDQVDAEGIGRYLPDELDDEPPLGEPTADGEPEPGEIVELERPRARRELGVLGQADLGPAGEGDGAIDLPPEGSNVGDGGSPGTGPGEGGGGEEPGGSTPESNGEREGRGRPLKLERARAYCVDNVNGVYRLVLVPDESARASIKVNLVGEVEVEKARVRSARFVESGESIDIDGEGKLGPVNLAQGEKYIIELALAERLRCSLGVSADADK